MAYMAGPNVWRSNRDGETPREPEAANFLLAYISPILKRIKGARGFGSASKDFDKLHAGADRSLAQTRKVWALFCVIDLTN